MQQTDTDAPTDAAPELAEGSYLALLEPSANRVYAATAPQMLAGELAAYSSLLLDGEVSSIRETEVAGVRYLAFRATALSERDTVVLGTLSTIYALFRVRGSLLEPVVLPRPDRYDDDLLTIQKYSGKTNEQFTRLLINLTAAALGDPDRIIAAEGTRRLHLLDPMCGRGTTLNQAALYGWDASGIDIDKRDFEAYSAFIQRWLKTKRIKHRAQTSRVRTAGETLGRRLSVEFAATRESYRAGDLQRLEVLNADTLRAADLLGRGQVDLIVTDAPYGVQHGATSGTGLARDPGELLRQALPGWRRVVKRSGAVGIAWNTHVLGRADLTEILAAHGFEVVAFVDAEGSPLDFSHRVDQSIARDLVVARPTQT